MLAITEKVTLIISIAFTLLFIFSCYILWDMQNRFYGYAFNKKNISTQALEDRSFVYVYIDPRVTKQLRRVSFRKRRQQRASARFFKKMFIET